MLHQLLSPLFAPMALALATLLAVLSSPFVSVLLQPVDNWNSRMITCRAQLAQDLQETVFQNDCGEDAHEVIRLIFR